MHWHSVSTRGLLQQSGLLGTLVTAVRLEVCLSKMRCSGASRDNGSERGFLEQRTLLMNELGQQFGERFA
jgi:hypothetical protein